MNNSKNTLPVLFLVMTNYTMSGTPINNLNKGLAEFQATLNNSDVLKDRIEFTLVTVTDTCNVPIKWVKGENVIIPPLVAEGSHSFEDAFNFSLDLIDSKIESYFQEHHQMTRPTMVVISDDITFESSKAPLVRVTGMMVDDYLKLISLDLDGTDESYATCIPSPHEVFVLQDDNNYDYTDFFNVIENYLFKISGSSASTAASKCYFLKSDLDDDLSIKLSENKCE